MECKDWYYTAGGRYDERFNRDIVECKDGWRRKILGVQSGFNRDIVECKGRIDADFNIRPFDLIETLWNVKKARRERH